MYILAVDEISQFGEMKNIQIRYKARISDKGQSYRPMRSLLIFQSWLAVRQDLLIVFTDAGLISYIMLIVSFHGEMKFGKFMLLADS